MLSKETTAQLVEIIDPKSNLVSSRNERVIARALLELCNTGTVIGENVIRQNININKIGEVVSKMFPGELTKK